MPLIALAAWNMLKQALAGDEELWSTQELSAPPLEGTSLFLSLSGSKNNVLIESI